MSKRSRWKKLRRIEELEAQQDTSLEEHPVRALEAGPHRHHDSKYTGIKGIYFNRYRLLLIFPLVLLLLAIIQIGYQTATTGEFLHKGVSLKGGVTITIASDEAAQIDSASLLSKLMQQFPKHDISVKKIRISGEAAGLIVEADIPEDDSQVLDDFIAAIEAGTSISRDDFSVELMGSSLGASFFRETFIAVFIAFLFMAIVVFIYFRTFVPSIAVVFCAFSDIVITLAIANIIGIKLSTAGIAAFLMLIGYSVDTDILLSTHILKRKEGSVNDRLIHASKTGMMMTLTTLAAVTVCLIVSESDVLRQIMTILLIGLIVDIINTWIQNVAILKIYLEKTK